MVVRHCFEDEEPNAEPTPDDNTTPEWSALTSEVEVLFNDIKEDRSESGDSTRPSLRCTEARAANPRDKERNESGDRTRPSLSSKEARAASPRDRAQLHALQRRVACVEGQWVLLPQAFLEIVNARGELRPVGEIQVIIDALEARAKSHEAVGHALLPEVIQPVRVLRCVLDNQLAAADTSRRLELSELRCRRLEHLELCASDIQSALEQLAREVEFGALKVTQSALEADCQHLPLVEELRRVARVVGVGGGTAEREMFSPEVAAARELANKKQQALEHAESLIASLVEDLSNSESAIVSCASVLKQYRTMVQSCQEVDGDAKPRNPPLSAHMFESHGFAQDIVARITHAMKEHVETLTRGFDRGAMSLDCILEQFSQPLGPNSDVGSNRRTISFLHGQLLQAIQITCDSQELLVQCIEGSEAVVRTLCKREVRNRPRSSDAFAERVSASARRQSVESARASLAALRSESTGALSSSQTLVNAPPLTETTVYEPLGVAAPPSMGHSRSSSATDLGRNLASKCQQRAREVMGTSRSCGGLLTESTPLATSRNCSESSQAQVAPRLQSASRTASPPRTRFTASPSPRDGRTDSARGSLGGLRLPLVPHSRTPPMTLTRDTIGSTSELLRSPATNVRHSFQLSGPKSILQVAQRG